MQKEFEKTAIRVSLISIVSNSLLAVIKWITGYFGNSYALIADAIESTTDVFASLLTLFGLKYSHRPADKNHPYGHGRVEPLLTFVTVAFLVTSATVIAYESIQNIQTPHEPPKYFTLIVLGVIIIWKEISFQLVLRKSKATHSSALKAEAWHHRSDAITSVAAFIGISIALYFGRGFEVADDWAALIASIFILYNSYQIFRPALGEIMDEHFYEELENEIRKHAFEVEGVRGTEKCFIRKSGMMYLVELHVMVPAEITVHEGHLIAHRVIDVLKDKIPQIRQVHVHIEPYEQYSES
ncbi:MAG: cation transporter [Saprospiraceae bacterium]|nr:cation transporter [Saprospiraceae bacterium]